MTKKKPLGPRFEKGDIIKHTAPSKYVGAIYKAPICVILDVFPVIVRNLVDDELLTGYEYLIEYLDPKGFDISPFGNGPRRMYLPVQSWSKII